jgi:DNA-binding NtrC family response regulator
MRILVMDDYRPHGESLTELLQTKGHDAIYAQCFADAEWLFGLFRFDAAFIDFDMPALSGPAVAAILSEKFPSLRSVIISAHAPVGARRVELGDLLFLQKPVPVDTLWELVAMIEREQAGSSLVRRTIYAVIKYQGKRSSRADRPQG